jgi:hypothetical protein
MTMGRRSDSARALAAVEIALRASAGAHTVDALLVNAARGLAPLFGALVVGECVRGTDATLVAAAHPDPALAPRLGVLRGSTRKLGRRAAPDVERMLGARARTAVTMPLLVDGERIALVTAAFLRRWAELPLAADLRRACDVLGLAARGLLLTPYQAQSVR